MKHELSNPLEANEPYKWKMERESFGERLRKLTMEDVVFYGGSACALTGVALTAAMGLMFSHAIKEEYWPTRTDAPSVLRKHQSELVGSNVTLSGSFTYIDSVTVESGTNSSNRVLHRYWVSDYRDSMLLVSAQALESGTFKAEGILHQATPSDQPMNYFVECSFSWYDPNFREASHTSAPDMSPSGGVVLLNAINAAAASRSAIR